jgi:hypothetical protein
MQNAKNGESADGNGGATEAFYLARAGFEITIAANTDNNRRDVRLFYPMAVLLKRFAGAAHLRVGLMQRRSRNNRHCGDLLYNIFFGN